MFARDRVLVASVPDDDKLPPEQHSPTYSIDRRTRTPLVSDICSQSPDGGVHLRTIFCCFQASQTILRSKTPPTYAVHASTQSISWRSIRTSQVSKSRSLFVTNLLKNTKNQSSKTMRHRENPVETADDVGITGDKMKRMERYVEAKPKANFAIRVHMKPGFDHLHNDFRSSFDVDGVITAKRYSFKEEHAEGRYFDTSCIKIRSNGEILKKKFIFGDIETGLSPGKSPNTTTNTSVQTQPT